MATIGDARAAFDSRHLDVLRAVAEAGSLSRAARRIHRSQPAITASIQNLEAALGVSLLERHPRGVRPTAEGIRVLEHARAIDARLDALVADVTEGEVSYGPLALGASTTLAAGLVPALYARFRDEVARVPLRLVVGNTSEMIESVRSGSLPLALVEGPPRAPGVRLERFVDDELLPVVSTGMERPRRGDILELPILWREVGSGTRAVVERALRRVGRRPAPGDLELGSTEAIRRAASLGLGVAFLSRWSIGDELATGRLRALSLPEVDVPRRFSWVMASRELSGTAASFRSRA